MWPSILQGIPFYAMYAYSPIIPQFYWNAKSQEQIIKYLSREYDKLIHFVDTLTDNENETRDAVNKLTQLFHEFQENGFNEYYEQQIYQWVQDNMENIISQAIKMVFFELTDDGYFVAYCWSCIRLTTTYRLPAKNNSALSVPKLDYCRVDSMLCHIVGNIVQPVPTRFLIPF